MRAVPFSVRPAPLRAGPWYVSRAALIGAFALVCLITIVGYASISFTPSVLLLLCTDGLTAIAWVLCAVSLGAYVLDRCGLPRRDAFGFAAAAALGLGCFSLTALGLGLAGALNSATAMFILVAAASLNARAKLRAIPALRAPARQAAIAAWLRSPAGWQWLWLAAAPQLGMLLVGASIIPGALWRPDDPHPYDVLEYHLQLPREWFEIGRIVPLKHNVFSFFPLNAEMQSLMAMHLRRGPYAGMYLGQFVQSACMILSVIAVYGTIQRVRPTAGPAPAVLAAVAMAAVPWTLMLGSVAYDESALLLYGTIAMGWVAIAISGSDRRAAHFALSGIAAGFACGVKYTAVPFLLVGIPVAAVISMVFNRQRRHTGIPDEGTVALLRQIEPVTGQGVEDKALESSHAPPGTKDPGDKLSPFRIVSLAVVFVTTGLLAFSPWLVKNIAWAGSPIFPLGMRVLGQAHFTETQVRRFEIAHSPTVAQQGLAGHRKAAWSALLKDWQYGYAFWPLVLCVVVAARHRREVWFLALLLLAIFITWIGFTHLLSRFFTIAIPVGALLIGMLPRRRLLLFAMATVLLMMLTAWWGIPALGTGIHSRLRNFATTFGQNGAFGLTDPRALVPDSIATLGPRGQIDQVDLQALLNDPSQKVALIGNAQPFIYSIPMSRLTYTTVFDLNTSNYPTAWLPPTGRGARIDRVLIIHPDEVERLANTYYGVPHLPTTQPMELNHPFLERR